MRFDYRVYGKGLNENMQAVDWFHEGQTEGSDMRLVILGAVRANTNVLDDCFGGPLDPCVNIWRNNDGTFDAIVDTHGLGDINVRLARAD